MGPGKISVPSSFSFSSLCCSLPPTRRKLDSMVVLILILSASAVSFLVGQHFPLQRCQPAAVHNSVHGMNTGNHPSPFASGETLPAWDRGKGKGAADEDTACTGTHSNKHFHALENIEFTGLISATDVRDEFLNFLPRLNEDYIVRRKSVSGHITRSGNFSVGENAVVLGTSYYSEGRARIPGNGYNDKISMSDLLLCKEVNVVTIPDSRCTVLVSAASISSPPYSIFRYEKADNNSLKRWKMKKWNSHHFPPRTNYYDSSRKLLSDFYRVLDSGDLETKIKARFSGVYGPLIVMVLNRGNIDLMLNFLCSVRRSSKEEKTVIQKLIVFAADEITHKWLTSIGVFSYYNPELGNFDSEHAVFYGDKVFVQMMWLKTISVYIVNRIGYSLLFQDADIVWLNPGVLSSSITEGRSDTYWQDDGTGGERYGPFFANTGFYYVNSNGRTKHLFDDLLHSYASVQQAMSHQVVINDLIQRHQVKSLLTAEILSQKDFPGGNNFGHNPGFIEDFKNKRINPKIFHMNWTGNKSAKLVNMKNMSIWYLKEQYESVDEILALKGGYVNILGETCNFKEK